MPPFVRGIVASHGIASHHSHHLALVIFGKQTSCALHDAEVVQIACQGLKRVVCHLALSQKMIVDLLVIAQGKSFGACKVKPCIKFVGGVYLLWVYNEGYCIHIVSNTLCVVGMSFYHGVM